MAWTKHTSNRRAEEDFGGEKSMIVEGGRIGSWPAAVYIYPERPVFQNPQACFAGVCIGQEVEC